MARGKEGDRNLDHDHEREHAAGQHRQGQPPVPLAEQDVGSETHADERHLFLDEKGEEQAEQKRDPATALHEVEGETEGRD